MSVWVSLFYTFFKIGLFSIGGGYNMIPMMSDELEKHAWLTSTQFLDILAVSEATPGPIAVNAATYVGWQVGGLVGAAVATIGVCLPGMSLALAFGALLLQMRKHDFFRAAMFHVRPALVGLLAATALLLAPDVFGSGSDATAAGVDWRMVGLFVAALIWHLWRHPHPLAMIAVGGVAGVLLKGISSYLP